jgi:YbbR domain-containing protein
MIKKLFKKHWLLIVMILIAKVLFLMLLKHYLFANPLAKHMKVKSEVIEKHILN